jgi:uncharacterized protein YbjT (DUF2867 family)
MILVIGASGTTGREVVRQLSTQGIRTRAFIRDPGKASLFESENIETFLGDLDDPGSVKDSLAGIGKIYLATPSHPHQTAREGSVIRAASDVRIQHILKLSTLGAKPDSPMTMSRWHGEIETLLTSSGLPYTLFRSHNFMQNLFGLVPDVILNDCISLPLGEAGISMVDARDIAASAVKVLTLDEPFETIYRFTGPEALTYPVIAEKLSTILGKPIRHERITLEETRRRLIDDSTPEWLADDLIRLYRQFEDGEGARITDDVSRLTGRAPITFDQFIRDYAEVFRGTAATL